MNGSFASFNARFFDDNAPLPPPYANGTNRAGKNVGALRTFVGIISYGKRVDARFVKQCAPTSLKYKWNFR